MKRFLLAATLVATAGAGCGRAHLGADHGKAYRASLERQANDRTSEEPAALDANDAKRILAVHRGQKPDAAAAGGEGAVVTTTAVGLPGMTLEGAGDGENPGIRLEAK